MPVSEHQNKCEERDAEAPHNDTRHGNEVTPEGMGLIPALNCHVGVNSEVSIDVLAVEIIEHSLNNVWVDCKERNNESSNSFASLKFLEPLNAPLNKPENIADNQEEDRKKSEDDQFYKVSSEIAFVVISKT